MSGPDPKAREPDEDGPGVLGSLPRTRPSVRSPRRADAQAEQSQAEPEPEPEESEDQDRGGREAEVEAVARAGISLAGEAATLGLRFAGRAAAALRDAVERS